MVHDDTTRGLRLAIKRVEARFKYDDHNPVEQRERVISRLQDRGTVSTQARQPGNVDASTPSATGGATATAPDRPAASDDTPPRTQKADNDHR